ncbi:GMC family oxidoreductase [Terriglobus sp. ADX1]|uniref:GMC family oxidoreductase n=1 Tax=Terriglobus sp. ADX1 TaxID=2794063 RepID=UPI002FE5C928
MDHIAEAEYIVVGSGAGGGTVATRLAESGRTVILLEAGADPRLEQGGDPAYPDSDRLPSTYDVPCFHPFASENEALRWDFFVRHYRNQQQQERDPKYGRDYAGAPVDGVLYPRAGTLGGCTAHNAMIFVYPADEDWAAIETLTGDHGWNPKQMRRYFQRLEKCRYLPLHRFAAYFGFNPSRHGFRGWLQTEKAIPMLSLSNRDLLDTILTSARNANQELGHFAHRLRWFFQGMLDPNDDRTCGEDAFGIRYLPLTTHQHARTGTRERVLDIQRRYPDRLRVELNALATRIIFDDSNRAIGVEYSKGARLYRAHASPSESEGELRRVFASHEVILSGGAFNTPQLLMLSGIGPREHLENFGIPLRNHLHGVGKNLQDRYEISIVYRMNFPAWHILQDARFDTTDPQFAQWERCRGGAYATNGSVLAVFRRSGNRVAPDLFCVAFLGSFKGYAPGYSRSFVTDTNCLTWAVLKAHTDNRAGHVSLRSPDPRDTPLINFAYFEEGTSDNDQDLDAVVEGVQFVRRISSSLITKGLIEKEEFPGLEVESVDQIRQYIRDQAWGHHASCTCPIGDPESGGVVDSRFRVHGTRGLRLVDASIFPRIPGFFLACPVYVVGEKAAADILQDSNRSRQ